MWSPGRQALLPSLVLAVAGVVLIVVGQGSLGIAFVVIGAIAALASLVTARGKDRERP